MSCCPASTVTPAWVPKSPASSGTQWSWGAIHATAAVSLTRDNRGEMFFGTIIEGPLEWTVRPVAEIVYEREFGATEVVAALVGVIWEARGDLAFDFAVRQAGVDGEPETEIRVGLTFAFSLADRARLSATC